MKNKLFVIPINLVRAAYLFNIACKIGAEIHFGASATSLLALLPDIAFISIVEALRMSGRWNNGAVQIGTACSLGVFLLMAGAVLFEVLAPRGSTGALIFLFAPIWQALSIPVGYGAGWLITKIAPDTK